MSYIRAHSSSPLSGLLCSLGREQALKHPTNAKAGLCPPAVLGKSQPQVLSAVQVSTVHTLWQKMGSTLGISLVPSFLQMRSWGQVHNSCWQGGNTGAQPHSPSSSSTDVLSLSSALCSRAVLLILSQTKDLLIFLEESQISSQWNWVAWKKGAKCADALSTQINNMA